MRGSCSSARAAASAATTGGGGGGGGGMAAPAPGRSASPDPRRRGVAAPSSSPARDASGTALMSMGGDAGDAPSTSIGRNFSPFHTRQQHGSGSALLRDAHGMRSSESLQGAAGSPRGTSIFVPQPRMLDGTVPSGGDLIARHGGDGAGGPRGLEAGGEAAAAAAQAEAAAAGEVAMSTVPFPSVRHAHHLAMNPRPTLWSRFPPKAPLARDESAVSRVSNYSIRPCIHDAELAHRFGAKAASRVRSSPGVDRPGTREAVAAATAAAAVPREPLTSGMGISGGRSTLASRDVKTISPRSRGGSKVPRVQVRVKETQEAITPHAES